MKKPLYLKIKEAILHDILTGFYHENDRLPSENQLAEHYQVSRITSKRVLNDLEYEGYITRKRGLGSYVNRLHQIQTHNSHKKDLLFIVPFADTTVFGNYTQGILKTLKDTPYRLQVQHLSQLDNEKGDYDISNVAGILFYPQNDADILTLAHPLKLLKIPTVLLDKEIPGTPFSTVHSNNEQGGYLATRYLQNQTHGTIAFLSSSKLESVSSVRQRYFGYLKALVETKTQPDLQPFIFNPDHDMETQHTLIQSLLEQKVTGIVCENDLVAMAFINALRQLELEVPQTFSIIGFDDIAAAQFMSPPLTTIQQNFQEIGAMAAKHLLAMLEGAGLEHFVIDVKLIERNSTHIKENL